MKNILDILQSDNLIGVIIDNKEHANKLISVVNKYLHFTTNKQIYYSSNSFNLKNKKILFINEFNVGINYFFHIGFKNHCKEVYKYEDIDLNIDNFVVKNEILSYIRRRCFSESNKLSKNKTNLYNSYYKYYQKVFNLLEKEVIKWVII